MEMNASSRNLDSESSGQPKTIKEKTVQIVVTPQKCRVCLNEGKIPIFSKTNPDFPLSHYLIIICDIDVAANDRFPQNLCKKCFDVLDSAIKLRKTAKHTQTLLNAARKRQNVNQTQFNYQNPIEQIKCEPELTTFVPTLKEEKVQKENEVWKDKPSSSQEVYNSSLNEYTSIPSPFLADIRDKGYGNVRKIKKVKKPLIKKKQIKYNYSQLDDKNLPPLTLERIEHFKKEKLLLAVYYRKIMVGEAVRHQCRLCKNIYKRQSAGEHLLSHIPGSISLLMCEICGKTFKKACVLESHKTTHENSVPFECKLCPYKGRTKGGLLIHTKRIHIKDYKYACTICPKKFLGSSNLQSHLRRHGEPKFQCETCQRFFYEKHMLKAHIIRAHTSTDPHRCGLCGNEYKTRRGLLKHEIKVHKRKQIYNNRAFYLKLARENEENEDK